MRSDTIYTQAQADVAPFQFNEQVADVFEDMIHRSVPGYALSLSMISLLAAEYLQKHSYAYDLGCSLGAATRAMYAHRPKHCRLFAVDQALPMLQRCRLSLPDASIALICADLLDVRICQASMVVMNYTLQFIQPAQRLALLERIHRGLKPGGIFVLSEKIAFAQSEEQAFHTQIHHGFKRQCGYSDLEIAQKRAAIEDVLIAESLDRHMQRLRQAGFSKLWTVTQSLNFVTLFAQKEA